MVRFYGAFNALILMALAMVATPATAQTTKTPDFAALDKTFQEWLTQNMSTLGSMMVMKDGEVVHRFSHGGRDPATPAHIASLSKAITAVCLGRLVEEGRISFQDNLGKVLAPVFQKLGEPSDERFKSITIEQLLTHRAGLNREVGLIGYRTAFGSSYGQATTMGDNRPKSQMSEFDWIRRDKLFADPGSTYSYSNIGYRTLGVVIETVTGKDYETHCRDTVLTPMAVTSARIDPSLRYTTSAGGWIISPEDYGRFIQAFNADSPVIGPLARKWMEAQIDKKYGLGTFFKRTSSGHWNYWHNGSLRAVKSGAYSFNLEGGWIIETNYQPYREETLSDLDKRIVGIFYPR